MAEKKMAGQPTLVQSRRFLRRKEEAQAAHAQAQKVSERTAPPPRRPSATEASESVK